MKNNLTPLTIALVISMCLLGGSLFTNLQANNWGQDRNDATTTLYQNYPNPFKDKTTISYQIEAEIAKLVIMDLTGKTIVEYELNKKIGKITVEEKLEPGMYFYLLIDNGQIVATKRMHVMN